MSKVYNINTKEGAERVLKAIKYYCSKKRDYMWSFRSGDIVLFCMPHDICFEVERYRRVYE